MKNNQKVIQSQLLLNIVPFDEFEKHINYFCILNKHYMWPFVTEKDAII